MTGGLPGWAAVAFTGTNHEPDTQQLPQLFATPCLGSKLCMPSLVECGHEATQRLQSLATGHWPLFQVCVLPASVAWQMALAVPGQAGIVTERLRFIRAPGTYLTEYILYDHWIDFGTGILPCAWSMSVNEGQWPILTLSFNRKRGNLAPRTAVYRKLSVSKEGGMAHEGW